MNQLNEQIARLLKSGGRPEALWDETLREVLKQFRSETGTIHRLDAEKKLLHLVVQAGLPPPVLEAVKTIPVGKGIARQVVARGGPVTLCNLQTDAGGVARSGARSTGVGGALCVPLRAGNKIVGTLGVGTLRPHEYTPEEICELEEIGRALGEFLKF